ncbi:hypothetical protein VNO78_07398 [Psophocarpus tetragonolobus]|uniref:Uncharacterized protein n=1 Tax=Psophocarpus tetragonolobus TaxID=3891 RepID=A0AAN9XSD0_PSOTE
METGQHCSSCNPHLALTLALHNLGLALGILDLSLTTLIALYAPFSFTSLFPLCLSSVIMAKVGESFWACASNIDNCFDKHFLFFNASSANVTCYTNLQLQEWQGLKYGLVQYLVPLDQLLKCWIEGIRFDMENVEMLKMATKEFIDNDDGYDFDPRSINWKDYMMNADFPRLMKHSLKALAVRRKIVEDSTFGDGRFIWPEGYTAVRKFT